MKLAPDRRLLSHRLSQYGLQASPLASRPFPYPIDQPWRLHRDSESCAFSADSSVCKEALSQRELYKLDRHLAQQLARLAPGYSIADIPRLYIRNASGILAFDDSWTLVGWSDWWHNSLRTERDKEVVVLHLDDHQDLVAPMLVLSDQPDLWLDPLTQQATRLLDPDTTASAVVSGAIGIGCFLVPCIHAWPGCKILHLQRNRRETEVFWAAQSLLAEPRISAWAQRPSFVRAECASPSHRTQYVRSSDFETLLEFVPPTAHILLHIDLDYFNDSLGGGRPDDSPQQDLSQAVQAISALGKTLEQRGMARRIEHAAVALSPGFCPSILWAPLLTALGRELRSIGCPVPYLSGCESFDWVCCSK
jgi:hypothetical protein